MKKMVIVQSIILSIILSILVIGSDVFTYAQMGRTVAAETLYSNTIIELSLTEDLFKLIDNRYSRVIFRLINDIDLATDESWHGQVSDWQANGWQPLDTYGMTDCVFDGGGHTVWNLEIDRADEYSGLFSQNSLHIKNLFFDFADIKGGQKSGMLTGLNYGTVENVHAKGNVEASIRAGGLIAENFGDIDNCSFDGDVKGRTAGGLIAENSCAILSNSCSQGTVKGHLAGGLMGVSGGFESGEIKTSFSVAEVISENYDSTPLRIAGFVAVKYETVNTENCYSLHGTVAVASGDLDGIITLSPTQFLQAVNLAGFDFDNYWTYATGVLSQRTLAVSSNEQTMSDVAIEIVGNRKYYLSQEKATLVLDAGGKQNIGIKSAVINGVECKSDFSNSEYDFGSVAEQINVLFEAWYLIRVEINADVENVTVNGGKLYYAPNEEISLTVIPNSGYAVESVNGKYKNRTYEFMKAGNDKYIILDLDTSAYLSGDVLQISASVIVDENKNKRPLYDGISIIFGSSGGMITAALIAIQLIAKKKKRLQRSIDTLKDLETIVEEESNSSENNSEMKNE
ncbi:MAG: hypothetical protein LBE09_00645 [Christensenellaceae bacterium]|jgi:hypothetical protein|nr:hypothetical protein [Christensenellaceae bacterium]